MVICNWKWRIPGHQVRLTALVVLTVWTASSVKGSEHGLMKNSMIRACKIPSLQLSNYHESGERSKKEMKSFIEMEYKTLSALNRTNANPHLVALVLDDEQFCSGTLLSDSFVLTSAHCTNNVKKIDMIFGTEDMTVEDAGVQKRTEYSTAVYEHPSYDKTSGSNDISLIRLNKPVFMTKFVKAVRIPDLSKLDVSLEGLDAEVVGWSESNAQGGTVYAESKSKNLRIASNSMCSSIHSGMNDKTLMCSKDGARKDLCQADAGSPVTARCAMTIYKKSKDSDFDDEDRCEFFDNCEEANEGYEDLEDLDDIECTTEEECESKKKHITTLATYNAHRVQDNKMSRQINRLCKDCKRTDPENFCFLYYHLSALENSTMGRADVKPPARPSRPAGSGSGRPNRPAGAPGAANRPNRPAGAGAGQRPNKPTGQRPNRPAGQRPSKPGTPGAANRPNRPAGAGQPSRPNKPARPLAANRPQKPGAQRPQKPANRPNKPAGQRPNKPANRPNKPANRPNRPNKPSGSRKPPVVTEDGAAAAVSPATPQEVPNSGNPQPFAGSRPNKPAGQRPNKPANRPNKPAGQRPNRPGAQRPNRPNKPANRPQKPVTPKRSLAESCDAFNQSPHVLLGVTSFGSCSDGLVFTKITPYMDFITSTLALVH